MTFSPDASPSEILAALPIAQDLIATRPQRNCQPPKYLQDYECYLTENHLPVTPRSHHQAVKDPRWVAAMEEEIQALHSNKT